MADKNQGSGDKSTLDKIIDIVHTMVHATPAGGENKNDPVSDTIKTLSNTSIIGGGTQRRKTDDAISASGG
jgi:hypothetical protein